MICRKPYGATLRSVAEQRQKQRISATKIKRLRISCLRLLLVDILLVHIPRHTKVCYFAGLSLTNQHISSSQVTMNDLVQGRKSTLRILIEPDLYCKCNCYMI